MFFAFLSNITSVGLSNSSLSVPDEPNLKEYSGSAYANCSDTKQSVSKKPRIILFFNCNYTPRFKFNKSDNKFHYLFDQLRFTISRAFSRF